jgi:ADP-ribosyl-[dinitrogen reductase] hydrolase
MTAMFATYPYCGDLKIDSIESLDGTVFGMVHMPGRNHVDPKGNKWTRDLGQDLERIEQWGAAALVTLVEDAEFAKLGVPSFADEVRERRFAWFHFPIPDMQAPGPAFAAAWGRAGSRFRAIAGDRGRIVVHCAGGLGRTGTFVAKLLVEAGMAPDRAVAELRRVRPGAVETIDQEDFIGSERILGN